MNLLKFSPLKDVAKPRQLWSWISFDVANQSFTLLINTLLFPIFLSQVVVRDDSIDDRVWALAFGSSMLITALFSPIAGAMADERACKKKWMIGTGLSCGLLTCALALIDSGNLWLAVLLYVPANFAFSIGENFLASFLPSLARQDQVGRVSGFSWACAYMAALLLLIITAILMLACGLQSVESWRPFFVFAGLWFIVFTIPTMLWLKEPPVAESNQPRRNLIIAGFSRLADSLRHIGQHRDLALLLIASLFYGTGMTVIVFYASKLAEEFGFTQVKLVLFVAVITVSGVIGTIVPTLFQDRIGHRRSILIFTTLWLFTALGFAGYSALHSAHLAQHPQSTFPVWPLWLIGNLLGFGLGSLGSANRAFVSYLTPTGREAETFGIWGLVWKITAITTFPFAWVKDVVGNTEALLVLAAFVAVGLVLSIFINEKRGALARNA
ncbi:MAG: MFS transporter [Verrucomicrobia bacterium]|nr:MFS transporter [Verrucomicrobiota bacterium]